jgi:hypothetical protein
MIHDINFNKIAFIDWSKVFIMPNHVFYNLPYVTIITTLALGSWLKQGLAKVRAKSQAWGSRFMFP